MPSQPNLLFLLVFLAALPILVGIRKRRQGIRHWLRRLIVSETIYLGTTFLCIKLGQPPLISLILGVLAGALVGKSFKPRSRHTPAQVRRRKIAEYEMKTGKKFDPKKLELDHIVAFSRGGSNTEDNLRVVGKSQNRSKGRKAVWWDVLGKLR